MFICEKPKVVFVAIPKTGTRSIYKVLKREYGGFMYKEHLPVIPQRWRRYFSFCVVRNPYDRVCSAYWSICQRKGDRTKYLARFRRLGLPNTLKSFLLVIKRQRNRRELPQCKFVVRNRMDQILRYETLQEDFNTLPFLKEPVTLPWANSTTTNKTEKTPQTRPHWKELVTPETGQMINEMFTRDFEMFEYPMEKF